MEVTVKEEIENRIHSICDYILYKEENPHVDLMNGVAGELLFLAYYSKNYSNPVIHEVIQSKLEYIFDEINSGADYPTFSSGICGINWVLEHIVKLDIIDFDLDSLYESTDETLYECMMYFIKSNNYDYLHGSLGIANYFANRNTPKTVEYVNVFINSLSEAVIRIEGTDCIGLLTEVKSEEKGDYAYNFSLSHGMASILYFLDKCNSTLDLKDNGKSEKIMQGLLNFFENHRNDLSQYNSFYPSWIGENSIHKNARIGWCYGDLSIASVFLNLKSDIKGEKHFNHAVELIDHSLKRTDPVKESILDAGICHGSSGLALIYHEAYLSTGKEEYLKLSDYWLEHSLNENRYSDGFRRSS